MVCANRKEALSPAVCPWIVIKVFAGMTAVGEVQDVVPAFRVHTALVALKPRGRLAAAARIVKGTVMFGAASAKILSEIVHALGSKTATLRLSSDEALVFVGP
jgi:hypothetical protein